MNIELKPCPFCGGEALTRSVDGGCLPSFMDIEKQSEIWSKTPYVTTCTLSCDECGATVQGYAATDDLTNNDLYDKAVEDCYQKWNRRKKMSDIIKCKDCAFYRNKDGYCAHNHGMFKPDLEDYCSHAEKKLPPKLKSCPFCGSSEVFVVTYIDKQYGIVCPECNVDIGKFETEEEVVETWNRRFY